MEVAKSLLSSGVLSDVSFSVGKEEVIFKAHKCILAVRSSVFLSMFNGNFRESKDETRIQLPDTTPRVFEFFLEYLYLNTISISKENWAPILNLVDKYDLSELKKMCLNFVERKCSIFEALDFYSEARRHHVLSHVDYIKGRIALNPEDSLNSDSFLRISSDVLSDILSDDELDVDEIFAFRAVLRWASSQIPKGEKSGSEMRKIIGPALFVIRFPRISPVDFELEVIPSGILSIKEITDIFLKRNRLKEDPIDFPVTARRRGARRFDSFELLSPSTMFNSVQFEVDQKVTIHGYGIYDLPGEGKVHARITLSSENGQKILGEERIYIEDNSFGDFITYFNFPTSISIEPNTLYTASLDFYSLPPQMRVGVGGKDIVNVDGVEWKFSDGPSSAANTNVNGGQFPVFYFIGHV